MSRSKRTRADWGTVEQTRAGAYRARYAGPDGKRHEAPHRFSSKTDARAWLATQRVAIANGQWMSPDEIEATSRAKAAATFGIYAEAWIVQRTTSTGKPLAPRTVHDYRRYLARGLSDFSNVPLTSITPAMVRKWHSERLAHGATQAGQEARFMHAVLSTAFKDELIPRNPVDAKLTRSKAGNIRRDIRPDELEVVLEHIGERFYLALILAAFGGLRNGEWRALRRRDLQISYGEDGAAITASVKVERQAQFIAGQGWIVGPPKSAEGIRIVYLPDWTVPIISEHLGERVGAFPDSLVFAPEGSSEFVHDRQFRKAWAFAKAQAGLGPDVTPHSLRHHAGTQFAATGATLGDIKARLGHSSFAAAMVYQHATHRDAELANRLPQPRVSLALKTSGVRHLEAQQ